MFWGFPPPPIGMILFGNNCDIFVCVSVCMHVCVCVCCLFRASDRTRNVGTEETKGTIMVTRYQKNGAAQFKQVVEQVG